MGARRFGTLLAVLGAAAIGSVGWGCTSTFACTDDAQCADAGTPGFCEPSGYCSFEDDTCPSNRRYGSLSGSGLANQCVPAADATSTTEGQSTSAGTLGDATSVGEETTSSTTATTMPVDPSTTGNATTTSTTAADTGTSTADATSSNGTTSGSASTGSAGTTENTTAVDPACTPVFIDPFEDASFDPEWDPWNSLGCSVVETGGHVEFSVGPSDGAWIGAGINGPVTSFLGGHTRVQVVPFEPPLDVVGVFLSLFDGNECEVQITVNNSTVHGHSAGEWFGGVAVDPTQAIWLQLRVESDGFVHWEWSSDGVQWEEVHAEMPPCDFGAAQSAVFSGGIHQGMAAITRAVESYERCEAP